MFPGFDFDQTDLQSTEAPTGALEVSDGCWMVGRRNPVSLLQCNTYLRTFERGSSVVHCCIDPGSRFDFFVIRQNIQQLIGDLSEVHAFTLNHQDPDVVGNALHLCEANPGISAVMTEEVWRLAQHLGFRPRRLHFANIAASPRMTVADRHTWRLVPTPFCHFRGAMAFYDPEMRTLFSGDLFGGLNLPGKVHLLAEESDWVGIAQFHQIYMPSREALRYAVRQIRALQPAVEVIAPQHGMVISGDLVPLFLDRMQELLVGLDLLPADLDQGYLHGYREVLARLLSRAAATLGRREVLARLRTTEENDSLEHFISFRGDDVQLEREGYSAIVKVFARLARREVVPFINELRSEVLHACSEHHLPFPPVGPGLEEGLPEGFIGPDGINMQPRHQD